MKDRDNEIDKNPKYDRYPRELASMAYNFFDKKTGSGASVKKRAISKITQTND